jgi:cell division protease FtsH
MSPAPATRELVDTETRRIIEECYEQALDILRGNRDRLDRLAHTLLDRETLEEDEAYAAAGISPDTAPAITTRSQAPGTTPALGASPAAAQAGADHVTPATSR